MADSGLDIEISVDVAAGPTIRVSGELDIYSAPRLRSVIEEASLVAPGSIVVDLSAVTFMDSSALGTLIAADGELRARQCRLILARPGERVWKVLEITGTHRALTVER
jgi:anti-sigma B factor antagonist